MKIAFILVLFLSAAFAYHPVEQDKEGKLVCNGCKTVVTVVEKWLASNKTITEISDALDGFCSLFNNTSIQKPCEEIIKFGVKSLVELLERRFPPETICSAIGLCDAVSFRILPFKVQDASVNPIFIPPQPKEGVVLCDGCKILVNAMHAWVNSESMRGHIDALFDKMCLLFNGTDFQPVCENIVEYGVDKVIEYVQSKLTPQVVCEKIKLCTSDVSFIDIMPLDEPVQEDNVEEEQIEYPSEVDEVEEEDETDYSIKDKKKHRKHKHKYMKYKKFYKKHHRKHHGHHFAHHHPHRNFLGHKRGHFFSRPLGRNIDPHFNNPFHRMMRMFKPLLKKFDDISITIIEENDEPVATDDIAIDTMVIPEPEPEPVPEPISEPVPELIPEPYDITMEAREAPEKPRFKAFLDKAKKFFNKHVKKMFA